MGSLRCVRLAGLLALLSVLAACSNGRGSVGEQQPPPAQGAEDSFTIGGNVSGLVGSGLVLQNNGGGNLPVAAGRLVRVRRTSGHRGGLQRHCPLSTYIAVAVMHCGERQRQRRNADISNIAVTCATGQFSIRGAVSGLTGSGLVLQNNGGNELGDFRRRPFSFANS
jgi:hypothetical protein